MCAMYIAMVGVTKVVDENRHMRNNQHVNLILSIIVTFHDTPTVVSRESLCGTLVVHLMINQPLQI